MPPAAMKAVNSMMMVDISVIDIFGLRLSPPTKPSMSLFSLLPMDGMSSSLLSGCYHVPAGIYGFSLNLVPQWVLITL